MAGNHPQLATALVGVGDLNRIYLEHQREAAAEAEAVERSAAKELRKAANDAKKLKKKEAKEVRGQIPML